MTTNELANNWLYLDYPSPKSVSPDNPSLMPFPQPVMGHFDEVSYTQQQVEQATYQPLNELDYMSSMGLGLDSSEISVVTSLPYSRMVDPISTGNNNNYTTSFPDQSFDILSAPLPSITDNTDNATISSSSSPAMPITPQEELKTNPYQLVDQPLHHYQDAADVFPNMGPIESQHSPLSTSSSSHNNASPEPSSSSTTTTTAGKKYRPARKQSESRISLPELYQRMGLGDDHETARVREQRVLGILKQEGFMLGERTWIRDTSEPERRKIIDEIHRQTFDDYQYSKELIEVIIRRGSYYLMQGRLRRLRRASASQQKREAMKARQQLKEQQQITSDFGTSVLS